MQLENLTIGHTSDFHRWVSNKTAVKYSLSAFSPNRDVNWIRAYIESLIANQSSWEEVIVQDEQGIGYCGVSNISKTNKCAEYFILIIVSNATSKQLCTISLTCLVLVSGPFPRSFGTKQLCSFGVGRGGRSRVFR